MTQASLQLSAVDLPGGIQRRRTTDDELSMRQVYREGDVIAAEVCPPRLRAALFIPVSIELPAAYAG